ncbi:MAG: 50S ribosomal protein L29 [Chloroflexi bacterium]|nr:50S ribosomal protein L29 [Chloroflexota bacterium]
MKVSQIRNMTDEELKRKISEAYQELLNLRFQFVAGQLKNTNRLKEVKKDIARMRTVWRERELQRYGEDAS